MPTTTTPPLPDSLRLQEREEIQYLLGNAPGWMMRFGITAVAGLLALLLWLSYALRYPDVVEAGVVLTMHRPPIRVMAAAGGRIAELHSSEGATVEAGAVLAVLENTADLRDVQQLVSLITKSVPVNCTKSVPPESKLLEVIEMG